MNSIKCEHCGDDCGRYPVMWENKAFCCNGCKTVFQILDKSNLYTYYNLENNPGIKIDKLDLGNKYAFLDNEEIKKQLIDFSEGGIGKISLFIPAIHCSSCIWLLENLHKLNKGIIQSNVNFVKKQLNITFRENEISLREIAELLTSIHYIPRINLESAEKESAKQSNNQLLIKIGIAGFCFGNIMLLSFPEYIPGGDLLEQDFILFFGWMNLILALPVLLYCSSDYYLSAYKSLRHGLINIDLPITIGIFTIFIYSMVVIIIGKGIGYMDSLAGLIFFLLIGKWYQNKTYQALSFERDFRSYFPVAVTKLIDQKEIIIPLRSLVSTDHILVRNQELIPADGRIIRGRANIDYSFVTGESIPIPKNTGDLVFAGGRQLGQSIELEIIKNTEQSYLTQLWNQDDNKEPSAITSLVDRVSRYFTLIIIILATAGGIFWMFHDSKTALFAFTSVLIVACPCALALTVPFTFGSTMRIFGRKGFYIKKPDVIEKLHNTNTIVFDKTGTITYSRSMKVEFSGKELSPESLQKIKSLVRHSTHPLSITILEFLEDIEYFDVKNFIEEPSLGISGKVLGKNIKIGSEAFVAGKDEKTAAIASQVYVSIDDEILGYFNIHNRYRKGLKTVLNQLNKFKSFLITGDNDAERENLKVLFGEEMNLNFRMTPTDKLNFIKDLKKSNNNVVMIGDGLNDAGALAESNVGITIADDIYNFSPACDAILEANKFEKLHSFIKFTSTSLLIVKISFAISFLYNFIGLYFALSGKLTPVIAAILMPVSSVSVVAFATISISLLAKKKSL